MIVVFERDILLFHHASFITQDFFISSCSLISLTSKGFRKSFLRKQKDLKSFCSTFLKIEREFLI